MLTLLIIFAVTTVTLGVLLFALAFFLQGWIYTEPSAGLLWQAPAAGAALGAYLTLWCALNFQPGVQPGSIPYDTLFRYSSEVILNREPVESIVVSIKKKPKAEYVRVRKDQTRFEYQRKSPREPWSGVNIEELEVAVAGETYKLKPDPVTGTGGGKAYRSEHGWTMFEYGGNVNPGPTGVLVRSQLGRGLMNWLLNGLFFALWFLSLWLLLRFAWPHALLLTIPLWLISLLTVLPMVLDQAVKSAP